MYGVRFYSIYKLKVSSGEFERRVTPLSATLTSPLKGVTRTPQSKPSVLPAPLSGAPS